MAVGEKLPISLHPQLSRGRSFYDKVRDFEDGTVDVVSKYLKRYATENPTTPGGAKAYTGRLDRLYNKNWIKPFVFLHLGHLSQDTTLNLPENETWQDIKDDVTLTGIDYAEASQEMLVHYMLDGRCGVLVDGPTKVAGSLAEAKAAGERSWQVIYEARDILNWSYFATSNNRGKLQELTLRDGIISNKGKDTLRLRRYFYQDKKVMCQILESEADCKNFQASWLKEEQFEVKQEFLMGENITEIPFVFFGTGKKDSFFSFIVDLNDAHMNRGSVRSNTVYNQGFQRVNFFGCRPEDIKNVGESIATVIPQKDARVEEIPAGDTTAVEAELGSLERYLTRAAKMEWNQLADDTRAVSSAASKRLDTMGRNKLYDRVIHSLERALSKIYYLHMLFEQGVSAEKIKVRIERDFGLDDDEMNALEMEQGFNWADRMGAWEMQQELLIIKVTRIKWVPSKAETREQVQQRLIDKIRTLKPRELGTPNITSAFDRLKADQGATAP